ncbi:MAG: hypothetical protein J6Y77_01635, partial [Paludibacteraceae bacterium]|nr:hypothetical protein [Paludibacteraceae bacterium]
MKRFSLLKAVCAVLVTFGFTATTLAQTAVPLGRGSYASSVPEERYVKDPGYATTYNAIRVENMESKKPLPTCDWWSQLMVDMGNSRGFAGAVWVYPQRVGGEPAGMYMDFPKVWTPQGGDLQPTNPNSELKLYGDGFRATKQLVRDWNDWGVTFVLTDENSKEIECAIANGIPYTYFNFKNNMPDLVIPSSATFFRRDGLEARFPMRTDCFGININGDHFGIFLPENTEISKEPGLVHIRFTGTESYLVVACMPDETQMDFFYQYAYNRPTDTKLSWSYDEQSAKLTTTYTVSTKNLRTGATGGQTIQGFIPHHYKKSEVTFPFQGLEYATPRGKMKCAVGNTFTIRYEFNGLLPWDPVPDVKFNAQYDQNKMNIFLDMYSTKKEDQGDAYWGGKPLLQMAQHMIWSRETGQTADYEAIKKELTRSLTDWYTYTPGERNHYYARNDQWGAFCPYDNIYAAEMGQDNHFELGYHGHAAASLMMIDEDFRKGFAPFAEMMMRQVVNWERGTDLPWFRNFSPWQGHSYAGPFGDGGGNGQESSSEAMQAWSALYWIAEANQDKVMRDAAIMGYTLEARATQEYWFDIDHENIDYDKYLISPENNKVGNANDHWAQNFNNYFLDVISPQKGYHHMREIDATRRTLRNDTIYMLRPYSANLQDRGVGWWTWFGGQPIYMHGIQWLPFSCYLKYLYE